MWKHLLQSHASAFHYCHHLYTHFSRTLVKILHWIAEPQHPQAGPHRGSDPANHSRQSAGTWKRLNVEPSLRGGVKPPLSQQARRGLWRAHGTQQDRESFRTTKNTWRTSCLDRYGLHLLFSLSITFPLSHKICFHFLKSYFIIPCYNET